MHTATPPDEVTTREALEILGLGDPSTVSRYVSSGILTPSRKLPGRTGAYLFRRADVEKLAAKRADAGHIDLDRALLFLGGCALGVIGALSPLDVIVTVAITAVCTFAAAWLVGHELFERRERRNRRAQVIEEAVCRRLGVEVLDHVVVPGRFSQIGTRK